MVLCLAFASSASAAEQTDLTPEKLADIKTSCVSMQVVLQKIQYNDAVNRVNRGQGYESLVARMMIPLNGRAAVNGFSNSASVLASTTTRYQQALDSFKNDFENYDNALSTALRVKCQEKPTDFYKNLTEARKQRTNLSNDVVNLSQLIEEYRQAVIKLKAEV